VGANLIKQLDDRTLIASIAQDALPVALVVRRADLDARGELTSFRRLIWRAAGPLSQALPETRFCSRRYSIMLDNGSRSFEGGVTGLLNVWRQLSQVVPRAASCALWAYTELRLGACDGCSDPCTHRFLGGGYLLCLSMSSIPGLSLGSRRPSAIL
jgi:hypothetical protein